VNYEVHTHIGTGNTDQNQADTLWTKPWTFVRWNKRKMSNKPSNSNLKEDQNINHATERYNDPNNSRDHKKLLITALHRKRVQCSTVVPDKGWRRDWLTTPQNFERRLPSSCKFLPRVLASRKVLHWWRIGNSFHKEHGEGKTWQSFFLWTVSRPFRPSKVRKPRSVGPAVTLAADFQLL
jgi:hypothetical protein